jgi:hypothetical protein
MLLLAALLLSGSSMTVSAQERQTEKAAEAAKIRQTLLSGKYKIDIKRAVPFAERTIDLTPSYSIAVRNDSLFSDLPYYGRAYSIPYGGGKGLTFNAPLSHYKVKTTKKGRTDISFKCRTEEDTYDFTLRVYDNGNSSVDVSMLNRQPIGFHGEIAD